MATSTKKTAEAQPTEAEPTQDEEVFPTSIAQPVNPNPPFVVEGSDGVVRIAGLPSDGWTPAPVEPSEEEVAAAEEADKRAEEQLELAKTPPAERGESEAEAEARPAGSSSTDSSSTSTPSSSSSSSS
jgi:hypothetical protein